jgi:hypothetical protein
MNHSRLFIFFLLPLLISFQFDEEKVEQDGQNAKFTAFLNLFYDLKLPLRVPTDSLVEYQENKRDVTGYTRYIRTRYKLIPDSLVSFIPEPVASKMSRDNHYTAVYKINFSKDFYTLIYCKEYEGNEFQFGCSTWLYICTYSLSGKLIDKMSLSGITHDNLEQDCYISDSLLIKIHRYESFPTDNKSHTHKADEILGEYQVSNTGKIVCQNKKRRKVIYTLDSRYEELVPYAPVPCRKP